MKVSVVMVGSKRERPVMIRTLPMATGAKVNAPYAPTPTPAPSVRPVLRSLQSPNVINVLGDM